MRHPDERACVGEVFHARDRGLRAQRRPGLRAALERELEAGIIAQIGRVVAVLIPGRDHHDPEPDDVCQTVPHLAWLTQIGEAGGDKTSQVVPAFDFP